MSPRLASLITRGLDPQTLITGARVAHHILELRRHQRLPIQALRQIQLHRLRALLDYAYANVAYYQRLFDAAGFKPEDLRELCDLRAIPITTKADVRDNPDAFLSGAIRSSRQRSSFTSGSTGIPLHVVKDARAHAYSIALKAYAFTECGVRPTDRFVTVAQSEGSVWPRHSIIPPSSDTAWIIAQLRRARPEVLYTYPSLLARLADRDVSGIQPRLIFSQGITLTQHCRNISRSLFGTDPLDTYGSVEFSRLAFECQEHSGLHIITDGAVVEFVRDGEPVSSGEPGDVVVTGLHNFAMPLIRYRLDDVAIPSDDDCSCGRGWPLIKNIEGRIMEYLIMPSGQKIFPGFIYYAVNSETAQHVRCIAQFQVVQVERNKLRLSVVRGPNFDQEIIARIKDKMERSMLELGENVTVEAEVVPEIPPEKSGKTKIVLSNVQE